MVYKFFGSFVNSTNAAAVLTAWTTDLPLSALRLRLTLEQALGSGMTAFIVVGRAILKYPDFPWAKLNMLTGGELTNYSLAMNAVNGNPYYGFNRTLGPVRSTLYSTIAYVAKDLLITLNGEVSLKRYEGWIKAPKSSPVVRNMLETYKQARANEMENDAVPFVDQELFATIAVQAANPENKHKS